jgi:uncharacterized PurR-regulated membrane protein YhhQ (DUF165 family)
VGEGVDTLVFVLVATLSRVFPWNLFGALVVTNYLFKVAVEIIMTPATYGIVDFLKQVEQEDYFDYETSFNPFRVH